MNLRAVAGLAARLRPADDADDLVRRHGPMVAGVCRRLLGPGPDADDAAQAVWLVFLRRRQVVRPGGAGPWLHGVAVRTARQVRSRRRRCVPLPDLPDPRPSADAELAGLIDAELLRLPAGLRAAVLLCEVEGRSLKAAAGELGVPVGTVASRLARGRQRLADRLRRRGVAVSVGGLSGWLTAEATARVPAGMTTSPAAEAISRGVLTMLLFDKLRRVAVGLVLAGGLLAAGGVGVVRATADNPPPKPAVPPAPRAAVANRDIARLWNELGRGIEDESVLATVRLSQQPAADVLAFTREHLKPVALTRAEADRLFDTLLGDDQTASEAALAELHYRNPRLVMDVETVWARGKTLRDRQRLAALLTYRRQHDEHQDFELRRYVTDIIQRDGSKQVRYSIAATWLPTAPDEVVKAGNYPRGATVSMVCQASVFDFWRDSSDWVRAARAVVVLETIGTPEAVTQLERLAAGHPDARPTHAAKAALARLAAR